MNVNIVSDQTAYRL